MASSTPPFSARKARSVSRADRSDDGAASISSSLHPVDGTAPIRQLHRRARDESNTPAKFPNTSRQSPARHHSAQKARSPLRAARPSHHAPSLARATPHASAKIRVATPATSVDKPLRDSPPESFR